MENSQFDVEALRKKPTDYTPEELAFMYKYHNQETY